MRQASARASAWRRRAFVAVVVLGVAAVALTVLRPAADRESPAVAADEEPTETARAHEFEAAVPTGPEPPRYFLAWTPGGLPFDFRDRVRTMRGLEATVVFAGDTAWLTRSLDRNGAVVDEPRPPYAFPIDAFAANPVEVAPFLPRQVRGDVVGALERGEAVLGARSATLRRIGVGGTLEFGDRAMRVGAVVPDELIGWSEVLVSREAGEPLGIVDDRYVWAFLEGKQRVAPFERTVRSLVPEDEPIRVVAPGGSRYMRVASGVHPPIVLKQSFGEFAAAVDPANPAMFEIDPRWTDEHLVTKRVPLLGKLTCHRVFMAGLLEAMRQVERAGLASSIHSTAGCFDARTVARSPTNPPSFHAYGAAVDINAPENPLGATPTMHPSVVEIFEGLGFTWGGDFLVPDGMHFEYGVAPKAT